MNVIELANQAGIRWDTDSDCSEWRMRRSELEEFANVVRNAALEGAAQICESRQTPGTGSVAILNGAADAIRNLKDLA